MLVNGTIIGSNYTQRSRGARTETHARKSLRRQAASLLILTFPISLYTIFLNHSEWATFYSIFSYAAGCTPLPVSSFLMTLTA